MVLKQIWRLLRGARGQYDEAMKFRNLVDAELGRRNASDLDQNMIDVDSFDEVTGLQTGALYLLLGFDPARNPESDEVLPLHEWDGSNALVSQGGNFYRSAILESTPAWNSGPSGPLEQDADLFGYSVRQTEPSYNWNPREGISLKKSVRHLIDSNERKFVSLATDVVQPLSLLKSESRVEYFLDILLASRLDNPDIYQLANASRRLGKIEIDESFFARDYSGFLLE